MNFKQAIEEMKKGKKVRRKGEYGWLAINNNNELLRYFPNPIREEMKTIVETLTLKNIESILADDWEVVEEKKKWYKPEMCNDYYYIDWDGDIDSITYDNAPSDRMAINIGNCFKELEQARFIVEKLKVIHELEKFAYENNSEEIDWNNEDQEKYIITFNHLTKGFLISLWRVSRSSPFNIYFSSEEIARKAIGTIGEERIKKYYFGIQEE